MGRELKRKQAKREGKNVREVQKKSKDKPLSPKTFITILVVIFLFFAILYIITGIFLTKEIKWFENSKEETETDTITNKILASDSLRQTEEDYYVYYYDTKENNSDIENSLYSIEEKIYRVDLNDEFNSNFIGEPSGKVENINDLKVSNPTLIKVSSEEIKEFYSGKEQIIEALK